VQLVREMGDYIGAFLTKHGALIGAAGVALIIAFGVAVIVDALNQLRLAVGGLAERLDRMERHWKASSATVEPTLESIHRALAGSAPPLGERGDDLRRTGIGGLLESIDSRLKHALAEMRRSQTGPRRNG
jgi:hypothetical protein